jgi:hypothetical protein
MASVAADMDEVDWGLMVEAGNMPLMSRYELAYLQTGAAAKMQDLVKRLEALEEAGLLETARSPAARDRLEKRKVVTTLGLEMLAAHWGTTQTNMLRMHPWPQVIDRKTRRPRYGLGWLGLFGDHYRLVRQFALALVHGGRCVSNHLGEVQVRVVTTIGSRLLYRDRKRRAGEKQTGLVKPDGLVWARVDQRGWLDGHVSAPKTLCENQLWLEIDRATVPLGKLKAKIEAYGAIWNSLQPMKPALVWVIDGAPAREVQILDLMRERGINGWTALTERLVLDEGDGWWLTHSAVSGGGGKLKVGLAHDAVGGMAPWREVWKTTRGWGEGPLLGVQPWQKRRLRQSPPRTGEQEWSRYRGG